MVPAQPTTPAPPVSNGAHPLIPQTAFNMPATAPFIQPPPSTYQPPALGYDSRMPYGAPDPSWNAPPPAARPAPVPVEVPAFAQHLPPDQRVCVI
jgi:hypothetical protein